MGQGKKGVSNKSLFTRNSLNTNALYYISSGQTPSFIKCFRLCSFMDDTKTIRLIESKVNIILEEEIYNQFNWLETNNTLFKINKLKLLKYGESLNRRNYKTRNKINSEKGFKDQGVIISPKINFKRHHKIKIVKDKKVMGMILRSFRTRKSSVIIHL